jgi:HAD superfamily phosphoserine phosphatase-like hydrolase
MNLVVLCDFDGTIVIMDTAEYTLRKYADGDWKSLEERFEQGEMSFEECIRGQFSMIKASEENIIAELDKVVSVRPNFGGLVEYCGSNGVSFVVVSGGFDFYIRHFLSQNGWLRHLEVYAPKSVCTVEGMKVTFPALFAAASLSFKDDLVRYYRGKGRKVAYIGNGLGDYPAASTASCVFAVKDSSLAKLCRQSKLPFKEITDFHEILEALQG